MKECPKCGTIYTDETLSFCLADGNALIANDNEQATVMQRPDDPFRIDDSMPPTAKFVPDQHITQPPTPPSSGIFKVLIAAAVVLVLLLAVLGAIGALIYFRSSTEQTVAKNAAPTPSPVSGTAKTPSPTPLDIKLPTPAETEPEPAEADKESLKAEVVEVEKEVIRAALRGDTASLSEILTDDFISMDTDGKRYNKKTTIDEVKSTTEGRSWPYSFGKFDLVSADDDTVVIRYILTISPPASEPDRTQLTETYVKQDGRWRLKFQKALTK
ncbi:MAG TPA: nuclear transport factor 2 family protein [Pyrinomonadaceae bacterium]|nr:nuclear transport factor 2 family protein [Chloracidobacterium sp.]MBP9934500.1 nuclear transport factor 2 family protein [Pyrinomonadaceae bacterium]MBK7802498.1 nuclear transport factor 2 family protein [Chloracidobacterium sp.]MBK9437368.1 nuclear transport factor 2 family protein [Chloracidobacterium sp.]MBK9766098.1 nuclear transport factor 2 family protein [Chloracidobacterium sp.]